MLYALGTTDILAAIDHLMMGTKKPSSIVCAQSPCTCVSKVEALRDGFHRQGVQVRTQEMGAWYTAKIDAANEIIAQLKGKVE